jgi:hypothetical protein
VEPRSDSGEIPKQLEPPVTASHEPAKKSEDRREGRRNALQLRWLLRALRERLRQ